MNTFTKLWVTVMIITGLLLSIGDEVASRYKGVDCYDQQAMHDEIKREVLERLKND